MPMNNRLYAAVCCFCAAAALSAPASAGERGAFPLNPASQPLLVLRADTASRFRELSGTRQIRALGLDGRDYSGRLPGVDARMASLRGFLDALARDGAVFPWYCLAQAGGSIAAQTGALGWNAAARPAEPLEDAKRRIAAMGLEVANRAVTMTPGPGGSADIVVARDAAALAGLLQGGGRPGERWRSSLASFLSGGDGGVGLLVNARPLLGLLSITLDLDLRSELSRAGLAIPDSLQLELADNDGDLGIALLCHSLLSANVSLPASRPTTILDDGRDALVTLHIPAPEQFAALLRLDDIPFFLANLNPKRLVPDTATLSIWFDERGRPAWSCAGLMPDGRSSLEQFRRLREWLDALRQAPSSGLRLENAASPSGHELVRVERGGLAFVAGMAEAPDGGAYWIAASDAESWPDPASFTRRPGGRGNLVEFAARLRPDDRRAVVDALAALARRNGWNPPADDRLDMLLPDRDEGLVAIEERTVRLQSSHGLLPLLLPALAELSGY